MKKLLLFILIFHVGIWANSDWPVWRGIHGDGISRQTGIMKRWQGKGPKLVWRAPLGEGFSGVSAKDGILYTLFADKKYEYIVAMDAKSGKKIWKKTIGTLYERAHGGGPRSTPLINSGKVYAVSAKGDMWCLRAKDDRKV